MSDEQVTEAFVRAIRVYFSGDLLAALDKLREAEQMAYAEQNDRLLATILVNKAGWLREQGQIAKRQEVLTQIDHLLPRLKADELILITTKLKLEQGIEARFSADFVKAEKLLLEAEAESRNHDWSIDTLSDILANLGGVYLDIGRLEEAQTKLMEAITIDRNIDNKRALSNDLNVLALIYKACGDNKTSDLYLKEAFEVAIKGDLFKEAADALSNSAVNFEEAGLLDEAKSKYKLVLDFYDKSGNLVEFINAKSNLAIIALKQGDLKTARQMFTETVLDHEKVGDYVHTVCDLINLSMVEIVLEETDSAYTHADKACNLAKSSGMLNILWGAHWVMAKVLHSKLISTFNSEELIKDQIEYFKKCLNDVLESYENAAEALEILRSGIGRPDEREKFLLNKEDLYEEALLLAGFLNRLDIAFSFSERARARAFLDIMGSQRIRRKSAQNPLLHHRDVLTQKLINLREDDISAQELYDELRIVRTQIAMEQPASAAITEALMPSYKEIIQVIPEDTALVEFFIRSSGDLNIFVLTSKNIVAMKTLLLSSVQWDLAAKVEQFRAELKYEVEGTPTGGELFQVLFGEIWDVIEHVERLLIVPHRELHRIPFSALWFEGPRESPERIYFCQYFTHSVLPSASVLPIYLNLARPQFQIGHSRVIANPSNDLPGAEEEGKTVATKLGVDPLMHSQATRDALLMQESNLSVVHVASHGTFNGSDPLLSGVEMADGRVTAEDIMESELKTGLLTLSGCVTGLAKREPGDELIGLSRAAASAGIPSVITSLWKVFDDSSNYFFAYFYDALMKGASKDFAMIAAQQALMQHKEFEHPVYWSPFILLGDWR